MGPQPRPSLHPSNLHGLYVDSTSTAPELRHRIGLELGGRTCKCGNAVASGVVAAVTAEASVLEADAQGVLTAIEAELRAEHAEYFAAMHEETAEEATPAEGSVENEEAAAAAAEEARFAARVAAKAAAAETSKPTGDNPVEKEEAAPAEDDSVEDEEAAAAADEEAATEQLRRRLRLSLVRSGCRCSKRRMQL